MAAPFTLDVLSKVPTLRHFLSPVVLSRLCIKSKGTHLSNDLGYKTSICLFANRTMSVLASTTSAGSYLKLNFRPGNSSVLTLKQSMQPPLLGLNPVIPSSLVPSRQYGRKLRHKPPRITNFEFSGDLRNIQQLDNNTLLYKYKGYENELGNNEVLKKLSSLEFATAEEYAEHRRQLIKDRFLQLFGPDCELEMKIGLLTLGIRQMIPYCIKYRTDKVNKVALMRRIFRRKKLLTRLRSIDHERFEWVLRELKIRYVVPREREEYKGWKHNLRVSLQNEAASKQRIKLEELKKKFETEKQEFFKRKAKVLAEIEEDLEKFGLDRSFLDSLLAAKKETSQNHTSEQQHNTQGIQTPGKRA